VGGEKIREDNVKKIISLFQRNYDGDRLVRDEVVSGAEWVLAGEGVATRKYDGTCCMMRAGKLYKRYDVKHGKTPPAGFEPAQNADSVTGHWPGWLLVGDGPEDRWHREAFVDTEDINKPAGIGVDLPDGTYELCGPKVQGNPEGFSKHVLIPHGAELLQAPRNYADLRNALKDTNIEGIVWHHQNGNMVKIKKKDFGFKRDAVKELRNGK
jgi:hypothetical protein